MNTDITSCKPDTSLTINICDWFSGVDAVTQQNKQQLGDMAHSKFISQLYCYLKFVVRQHKLFNVKKTSQKK